MVGVTWRRVNLDPYEYAIQQGQHGDEFVKLLDGSCLRRNLTEMDRPVLSSIAPRPWRVDRDSEGKQWTNSCSILDAEDGEVCVLTRGYQGDEEGDDCPSWDNAELIVAAVNAYEQSVDEKA